MTTSSSPSTLRAVALCVFLSGTASLALEIVWSRLLKLVFGSTTLAITTILVAYMLGLGLGGLFGGSLARRLRNGVRAYGLIEIGIGIYALFVPWILDLYPTLHRALEGFGFWPAAFVRFGVVAAVLLLPTLAMGATLPLLVEALVRDDRVLAGRVGLLYGVNTLGAVAGVLLATFVGFATLGVRGTNTAAALVDIAVGALAAFVLARRAGLDAPPTPRDGERRVWRVDLAVVTYAVVGCTALAYEVAWTRGLSMILGSSTYAFATILAGFLAGIALGSLAARRHLDRIARPREAYALGLLLLGVAAWLVARSFQELPGLFLAAFANVGIAGSTLVWMGLGLAFVVMLAPTIVLGALFPLVTRIAAESRAKGGEHGHHGTAVGAVYFFNTLGSAVGAFAAGFVLIPRLGLPRTLAIAIALNFLAAALVWSRVERRRPVLVLGALAAAAVVLWRPPAWDAEALASGVYYRTSVQLDFGLPKEPLEGRAGDELLFYREGLNCTVSIHKMADGLEEGGISMRVNGKTDASLADMSTQVLSGHIPFVFGAPAERALVIGYASGITAGAAALHVPQVDVCEIEPAVIEASRYFDEYNHRPLEQEGVHLIVDDGRSYLAASDVKYDVIVSEPSNPWIAGCANLFTSDFFAIAHDSLQPDGRLLQWIQLYGMSPEGLRSVLAALHEQFDYAYGFLFDAYSTDLLLLATDRPLDVDALPRLENLPEEVRRDLSRVRVFSTGDLWSLLRMTPENLAQLAGEATAVNTDDSMFVELAAPWALYDESDVTKDLVRERGEGLLPLLTPEAPVTDAELGELALSFLYARGELKLADATHELLLARGGGPHAELYDALLAIEAGEPDGRRILSQIQAAAAAAPDSFAPHYHLGRLLNEIRNPEGGLREIERALSLRPGDLLARHERAKAFTSLQRMREAYDEIGALLASPLVETQPRLWAEAAYFSGGFSRFDEAIERMEHYLELEPYKPDEWEQLALWYELVGRDEDARAAQDNIGHARYNSVRSLHWVARWHERFGTREEAVIALQEVVRLAPDNAEARADLERLQESGA